jgi:peptidoglycan hydrolase CwlO-like protein
MQFDDFMQVLDLIKNPKDYEAKVNELVAQQATIQSLIDELNIKGDIAKAQQQAETLVKKATAYVEDANKQAAKIIADAQAAFDKRNTELQAREVIADQKMADYNTMKNQEAARNEALRQQEKRLAAMQADLEDTKATLRTAQTEVDERLTKLRQVMG